jgi:hypothetical protein
MVDDSLFWFLIFAKNVLTSDGAILFFHPNDLRVWKDIESYKELSIQELDEMGSGELIVTHNSEDFCIEVPFPSCNH